MRLTLSSSLPGAFSVPDNFPDYLRIPYHFFVLRVNNGSGGGHSCYSIGDPHLLCDNTKTNSVPVLTFE